MTRALLGGLLIISVASILPAAGGPRKIWQLELAKLMHVGQDEADLVWGARFSADESQLAVGLGPAWNQDPRPHRLIIIPLDHPRTPARQFELRSSRAAPRSIPVPSASSIAWSPSGQILVIRASDWLMLRLNPGEPCKFPSEFAFAGFLSGDRMVLRSRPRIARGGGEPSEILVLRPDCSISDQWRLDDNTGVLDTSPENDLIALGIYSRDSNSREWSEVVELVSAAGHEVKQRWTFRELPGFLFADKGNAVCGPFWPDRERENDLACWDAGTGAKIGEDSKAQPYFYGGGLQSTGGDVVAMVDSRWHGHEGGIWRYLDIEGANFVPKRNVVWNFRTGQEVLSLGHTLDGRLTQFQLHSLRDEENRRKIRVDSVLALSPTGKYLAEAGSGVLSLYSLQP